MTNYDAKSYLPLPIQPTLLNPVLQGKGGDQKCLTQNIFQTQIFSDPNFCLTKKIFFGLKIFDDPSFLGGQT